jgi:hypothetical protein
MNSEEQYKHIEHKIIEAANGSNYSYTEEAWKKMELLLDERDKKRRPFFWLWPFVLCTFFIGGYFIYQNNFSNKNSIATNKPINKSSDKVNTTSTSSEGENTLVTNKEKEQQNNQQKDISSVGKLVDKATATPNILVYNGSVVKPNNNANNNTVDNYGSKQNKNTKVDDELVFGKKRKFAKRGKTIIKISSPGVEDVIEGEGETEEKSNVTSTQIPKITKEPIPNTESKKGKAWWNDEVKKDSSNKKTVSKADEKKKTKKKFPSDFFVVASIGAEASSTKLLSFKNSTIMPRYGFAIGYQINKKLSVQSGFFASAKKYIAAGSNYNIKSSSYLSTVNLISADANCKVYEVPLSIQYDFLSKQNLQLYSSVGLSTYFMKNENYVYTVEHYGNIYATKPYDYTGNKHLFSVLNFSFGVKKKIKSNLFIQASPTVNIPLGGVGEGRIKLFSTSLNVGVKYFPFKK